MRAIVAAVCAALMAAACAKDGAEFELRLAHDQTNGHPYDVAVDSFAARVARATGGAVQITPPYGLCLLIAADLGKMSVGAATRAMVPFYLISLLVLAIAVLLPDLVLWIPRVAMANLLPSP